MSQHFCVFLAREIKQNLWRKFSVVFLGHPLGNTDIENKKIENKGRENTDLEDTDIRSTDKEITDIGDTDIKNTENAGR